VRERRNGRAVKGGALVAASILDADFGNLYRVVRKLEKAGVDRLHLDVMDGHFVPNITFGSVVTAAIHRLTDLPLDVHLMIAEPARYAEGFISAGADSITFHVEVQESHDTKLDTLQRIRAARVRSGLAISPKTAVDALRAYSDLLDIVMVMTVEPGFGGQKFMADCAAKIPDARELLTATGRDDWEVHVDGGVSHETAAIAGGYGGDVLVVGSALFQRGQDAAREIRLVKSTAIQARRGSAAATEPAPAGVR
jgi:ribulose-phosphate 3-epimerase